jgi:hypothetical protein
LTTNDPKIDLKLSKPDPRPHLTGFPPEPKEKKVFGFFIKGFTMCNFVTSYNM